MRIPVNLASQPLRRDRPMLVGSVLLGVLMIGLLGALVSLAMTDKGQRADLRRDIAQLQNDLNKVTADQRKIDAVMRQPEHAAVLDTTIWLNDLLRRKGISWTKMLSDLEKTVPPDVRVVQIRPSVNGRNQITLDMTVASEKPEPVIEFFKKLEADSHFGMPTWRGQNPPNQNDPLFKFRLTVNYAQQL